jgi:hypothetical protein
MYSCPDYEANHFEPTGSAFGTVHKVIFVSGRCQRDRNPAPQVSSPGSLGFCSAFGI